MARARTRAPGFLVAATASLAINAGLFSVAVLLSRDRPVVRDITEPVPVALVQAPAAERRAPEPVPEPEPPRPEPAPDFVPELFHPLVRSLAIDPYAIRVPAPSGPGLQVSGGFIFEASDLDQAPRVVVHTPPIYPSQAHMREIEGYVEVRFLVDEQGQVSNITVLDASPPGTFDEAVVRAVGGWRFDPGRIDGRPVASWVETTIRFELS
jgi:protein TonB